MKEAHPLIDSIANLTQRAREWGQQAQRPLYAVAASGAIALSGCSSPSEVILGPETTQSTETPVDEPTADETMQTSDSEELAEPTPTPNPSAEIEEAQDRANEELAENYEDQSGTAAAEYNASAERNEFLKSEMETLGVLFFESAEALMAEDRESVEQDFFNFETEWRGFGAENQGWGLLTQKLKLSDEQTYQVELMVYLGPDQKIDIDEGVKSVYAERINEVKPMTAGINSAEYFESSWYIVIPDGSYSTTYLQKASEIGDQEHDYRQVDGIVAPEMTVGEIQEVDELAVETLRGFVAELELDSPPQAGQTPTSDK